MHLTKVAAGLFLAGSVLACAQFSDRFDDACPANLNGAPSQVGATESWSMTGKPPIASVLISAVAVECIPDRTPAVTTDKEKVPARTSYRLATTSTVMVTVLDSVSFMSARREGGLSDNLIVEALSGTGVVLGSGTGHLKLEVGGVTTVSVAIYGLSAEEVRRVQRVTARWSYSS